jgi:hypothetical protein
MAAALASMDAAPRESMPAAVVFLNCAGLHKFPLGTRFKIEVGQRFDSGTMTSEHRFVVFGGVVGLIYFRLLDAPGGGYRGEATSLNVDTWEHETVPVTCRFETSSAF